MRTVSRYMLRERQRQGGSIVTTYLEAWLRVPRAMTEKAGASLHRSSSERWRLPRGTSSAIAPECWRCWNGRGSNRPDIIAIIESTSALSRRLENEADSKDCMVELVDRIELCDDGVAVTLEIRVSCFRAGVQTSSILGLSSAQRNALGGIKQGAVFSLR
jgi:hypothetical protein